MTAVRSELLTSLLDLGLTPVLACLAIDESGGLLNVNADEVAGAVAGALDAPALFLTDVPGVLADPDDPASRLATMTRGEVERAVASGTITGGMVPKVEAALAALALGAPSALIADGRRPDAIAAALEGADGTRLLPS
jgi:acetylglutamate kinase